MMVKLSCAKVTAKKIWTWNAVSTQQGGKKEKFHEYDPKIADGLNKVIDYIENK